jgi:hypothetical protein
MKNIIIAFNSNTLPIRDISLEVLIEGEETDRRRPPPP